MSDLIDILKNDFKDIGKYTSAVGTGIGKGVIRGMYSPILIGTGTKQFIKDVEHAEEGVDLVNSVFSGTTQICTALVSATIPAIMMGWKYFAIIGTTNAAEYLYSVHKRTKQKKEQKQKEE